MPQAAIASFSGTENPVAGAGDAVMTDGGLQRTSAVAGYGAV
jgi:hypothetical protein